MQLRLGDRLQVRWDVDALPPLCVVPSLLLQPLLENAIGHGIGMVFQHFQLADNLTVTENVVLGAENSQSSRR